MTHPAAILVSVEGLELTPQERRLFASTNPLGFILFQRNCDNPDQVRALNADLRECVGRACPILIDQEGGKVQILNEPYRRQYPSAQSCEVISDVKKVAQEIAKDLSDLGITANCAPVLDVLSDQTHEVIGDRAFSRDSMEVYKKGLIACQTYLEQGVTPIVKHLPGHGRASDSHIELPVVNAHLNDLYQTDFLPFQKIAQHELAPKIWGIMAHVLFTALDSEKPVTYSKTAINFLRQELQIDQFLIADHISMDALAEFSDLSKRALKTLEAGCDATLYTEGLLSEMEQVLFNMPSLSDESIRRLRASGYNL